MRVSSDRQEHSHMIDTQAIRNDFPILSRFVNDGIPLVYLDSAATSQKPAAVIRAMTDYYELHNANIHRGVHTLALEATELYENARKKVADFIRAGSVKEIIFTRNATESINLVAQSWAHQYLRPGDLVVLTEMEHHSNLVPWQILQQTMGVELEFVPLAESGELDQDAYRRLIGRKPKLVAVTHMSNVLGTINPVEKMVQLAHSAGAKVLVDGAQSAAHLPVDMAEMDADFFAFSGHKMCGPTGIGVLYGKLDLLKGMPPFLGGGDMIKKVEWRKYEPNELPHKFEAGTPAIAEAVGLGAAVDYLRRIGLHAIHNHEIALIRHAMEKMSGIRGLHMIGPAADRRGGLVSFVMDGVHPHDIAQILDARGIAVRAGHHCTMPLHQKLGLAATTRASFYLYNTLEEIDALVDGLRQVRKIFG
jgi:cysteine desulfurase/selenocysteine lyase